jgi:hypothetical protein
VVRLFWQVLTDVIYWVNRWRAEERDKGNKVMVSSIQVLNYAETKLILLDNFCGIRLMLHLWMNYFPK